MCKYPPPRLWHWRQAVRFQGLVHLSITYSKTNTFGLATSTLLGFLLDIAGLRRPLRVAQQQARSTISIPRRRVSP
jgi:hypothetical protein